MHAVTIEFETDSKFKFGFGLVAWTQFAVDVNRFKTRRGSHYRARYLLCCGRHEIWITTDNWIPSRIPVKVPTLHYHQFPKLKK